MFSIAVKVCNFRNFWFCWQDYKWTQLEPFSLSRRSSINYANIKCFNLSLWKRGFRKSLPNSIRAPDDAVNTGREQQAKLGHLIISLRRFSRSSTE